MKKTRLLPIILTMITAVLLLAASAWGLYGSKTARADSYSDSNAYTFYFENYDVVYDIESNRKISFTEKIQVRFTGYASTGFIKDIPVNGGELVRKVKVYSLDGFNATQRKSVYHKVYLENRNFVSVDIGDSGNKTNKSYTFLLTYDYCLTKAQEGKNALSLNPIGLARDCEIKNASVTLVAPKGFIGADWKSGSKNSYAPLDFTEIPADGGKTALRAENFSLDKNEGVTVDMKFENGSLKVYSEFTPYIFVIISAVGILAVVLLRLFVFNKNALTPVVNYEAPDKMDPLMMGKLIDNKIDNEDITSLIYYWADKGYLKINLDNKINPTIIRTVKLLPEGTPLYEQTLFYGMFGANDAVRVTDLRYKYYKIVQQAKQQLVTGVKRLYNNASIIIAAVFAAVGGAILGLAPLIMAMSGISFSLIFYEGFIALVPLLFVFIAEFSLVCGRLKTSGGKFVGLCFIPAGLCALVILFYTLLIPSAIIPLVAKLLISLSGCVLLGVSVILINRSKEYNAKLNEIIGFKQFITLAEKDRLEKMIESDPQFYYHILPYAQVLGVTKTWEDKFEGITVQPPDWIVGDILTTAITFHALNSLINASVANISSGMVSAPSSSGMGGFGGFGGGGMGGGHGGGGFRGR